MAQMHTQSGRYSAWALVGMVVMLGLLLPTQTVTSIEPGSSSEKLVADSISSTSEEHGESDVGEEDTDHILDEYRPLVKVAPVYPRNALRSGIQGYVVVQFDVTEKGKVRKPVVIESKPYGIFHRSAINAVKKFRYLPRIVDGSAVRVEGVQHRIVFNIEGEPNESESPYHTETGDGDSKSAQEYLPIVKAAPQYPREAARKGFEGYVIVRFAVTEKGDVEDPVVVASKPEGVFDSAATKAVLKFKYQPRVVDGEPIRVDNVMNKFVFELTN